VIVVRGATVLDGTGNEGFVADVVVQDGRIASIGRCEEDCPTVDGEGLYLAPGFIDCHCHDDLAMLREPDRPEKVAQGVTTVVVGNCGFSLFPTEPDFEAGLRGHAGGLLGALREGEVFESFSAYAGRMHAQGIAINVSALVGHGPLRLGILGYDKRPATAKERRLTCDGLEKQLQAGAAGLSLGLVYPPSAFADREELVELCRTAARCGKPVAAHVRSYEAGLPEAVDEFLDLLRASGARGVLSHLQAAGRTNWGLVTRALVALDKAQEEGIDVGFDMYPYLAGSSYALQLLPPSALTGGPKALKGRLREPGYRQELRTRLENPERDAEGWQSKIALIGWESVLIAGTEVASLKPLEGKTLLEAAGGGDPFDVLERLVMEEDGATAVILFQLAEGDLRAALTHPMAMVGSDGIPRQDGRPHPRAFGAFPRVLHKLAKADNWFSLQEAVRRMTSEPAARFGLSDRGVIRPGAIADMVLFDPSFQDLATYEEPRRLAEGARWVWVNGVAVLADGRPTSARPGRAISHRPAA
jgi:N-acyl-D-amino-acid deacylase